MKISIIIPVFNEEKTIAQVIEKVLNLRLSGRIVKEIIVVDDGSTDNTEKVLSKCQMSNVKCQILTHKQNQGKGSAISTGLKHSTGDVVVIQDSDLEYDPQFLPGLLKPVLDKKSKVVYGTRLLNYPLNLFGKNKTVLPTHLLANRFLTFLTNILYNANLSDMETGYKIFDNEILKSINLNSKKFDFEAEITAKILKKGIKILEIPIKVKPRSYKEGKKIGWKDGVMAIWTLIKYRFSN